MHKNVKIYLIFGLLLNLFSNIVYFYLGFSLAMLFSWLISVFLVGFPFYLGRNKSPDEILFSKKDYLFILILLVIFVPLYFWSLYLDPFRVNTDEVLDMFFVKHLPSQDPFGVSTYAFLPNLQFIFYGSLANIFGGYNLYSFRIISAATGLAIVILGYFFFRVFFDKFYAFSATLILGSSHVFILFVRSMYRLTIPILIFFSLALLIKAVRRGCQFYSFLGGLILGLGYYFYYSGRIIIFLWIIFLLLLGITKKIKFDQMIKIGAVSILGFIVIATPILVSNFKTPNQQGDYTKKQLLILKEGRQEQMVISRVKSELEAIKLNALDALTSLNLNHGDRSFIYSGNKYGFLDPFTAVLVWIGIVLILIKKKFGYAELLFVTGFFCLMMVYAFITNRSPHYARMLLLLPSVSFVIVMTLKIVSAGVPKYAFFIFNIFLFLIVSINLLIFLENAQKQRGKGDVLGWTARYMHEKADIGNYSFYIADNSNYPYYYWGGYNLSWFNGLISNDQKFQQIKFEDLSNFILDRPSTLFIPAPLWIELDEKTKSKYSNFKIYTPDGKLVTIELN